MSSQSISSVQFSWNKYHEGAFALGVKFLTPEETRLSTYSRIFKVENSFEEGEVLDIYSQNGIFKKKQFLNKLFTAEDYKGMLQAAMQYQITEKAFSSHVLVLDVKDGKKSYENSAAIQASETAFCSFVQEPIISGLKEEARKVHELFQGKRLPCDFVICEGSLKHELLKGFSPKEQDWFLKTREGAIDFCKYAEFYMNGFKFGCTEGEISSERFIVPVSGKETFKPQRKSTVWYPELYKKIYSPSGEFAQALQPAFSVVGSFNEHSKITSLTMELQCNTI